MEMLKIRKMIGETIRVAGLVTWLLGTDFVSGLLRGFLGMDVALNEILFLGNSLCHWGIILVVGGYILKMYRKGLSKKTKLLVIILCALYVLLFVLSLIIPSSMMAKMGAKPFDGNCENLFYGLMIIVMMVSICFWGALLSGLYRMYREAQELDRVTKTDTKSVAY